MMRLSSSLQDEAADSSLQPELCLRKSVTTNAPEREQVSVLREAFYRERAKEKLLPRVRYWERKTGLKANDTRIRSFQSRWASCSSFNILEFHPRVMELASSIQDYVIVHELCHIAEKSHNKEFWNLVSRNMPNWQPHHSVLELAAFGDSI